MFNLPLNPHFLSLWETAFHAKLKNQNIQNFTWLKKSFPMQMESQKIAQSECIKKWILDSKKKICYVSTHNIACIWRADGLILYKLVSDPIVCYWTIKHV